MAPVYLCYDDRMLLHRPVGWKEPEVFPTKYEECLDEKGRLSYPLENPERLSCVYKRLMKLQQRIMASKRPFLSPTQAVFLPVTKFEPASRLDVLLAHSADHYDRLASTASDPRVAAAVERQTNDSDIYICQDTFQAARLAVGGLLQSVVTATGAVSSYSNRALALLRPPGHHACQAQEMGFSFFNSVAIAAKYALHHNLATRVLIFDYDIHHGNGTQELTYGDDNVFYLSLHRYTGMNGGMAPDRLEPAAGDFFPYTGHPHDTGGPRAEGTNCNVAWTRGGMGNAEYAAALSEIVWPVIHGFQPDLVLVSCGVDAAAGDLIGDCLLTPEFFHAMTRSLLTLVGTEVPVVHALEGGYAIKVLTECMEAVTLALLDIPYHNSFRGNGNGNGNGGSHHLASTMMGTNTGPASMHPWMMANYHRRPNVSNTEMNVPRRLVMARDVLAPYWRRNDGCGGQPIQPRAVVDMNKTISALQKTGRWDHVPLRKVKNEPGMSAAAAAAAAAAAGLRGTGTTGSTGLGRGKRRRGGSADHKKAQMTAASSSRSSSPAVIEPSSSSFAHNHHHPSSKKACRDESGEDDSGNDSTATTSITELHEKYAAMGLVGDKCPRNHRSIAIAQATAAAAAATAAATGHA